MLREWNGTKEYVSPPEEPKPPRPSGPAVYNGDREGPPKSVGPPTFFGDKSKDPKK